MAPHTMIEVFDKLYGVGQWCVADRGRMTTSTDPVVSAQHHELVKDELFAFARYLYDEIESHTSVNITFDESVWDYT